jgi:hypothetical protein
MESYITSRNHVLAIKAAFKMVKFLRKCQQPKVFKPPSYKSESFSDSDDKCVGSSYLSSDGNNAPEVVQPI